ncbi:hypothetical protein V8G54_009770 [Vigna mungo]|uniref:Uncharacterized protein n=1 Tax=Vigna mungo TaxID=3915 RepID=A0AAQ3S566_VIGMU
MCLSIGREGYLGKFNKVCVDTSTSTFSYKTHLRFILPSLPPLRPLHHRLPPPLFVLSSPQTQIRDQEQEEGNDNPSSVSMDRKVRLQVRLDHQSPSRRIHQGIWIMEHFVPSGFLSLFYNRLRLDLNFKYVNLSLLTHLKFKYVIIQQT